jgi:hypothetical protein
MAAAWIGEACSNPSFLMAFSSSGERSSSENRVGFIQNPDHIPKMPKAPNGKFHFLIVLTA